jgi:hypothetical protein
VTEGVSVSFAATASDAEDGDLTAAIAWTSNLDGALGTGATLDLATLSVGLHTITASVADSLGEPGSAQVTLTIAGNAAPTVSITSPVDGTSETEGVSVSFAATASDAEDGDLTAAIAWTSDLDGAIGSGGSLALATLSAGLHTITASIVDSLGEPASDQLTLTIAVNAAPTVSITAPADATTETEGVLVSFAATAGDAEDGDLTAAIAWTSDLDGSIGSGGSFALATLSVGTHTITAAVTDSLGAPGSMPITLTIAVNAPPVLTLTSPADGTTETEGVLVSFAATASDADEGDVTGEVVWSSDLDGPLGTGGSLALATLSVGAHTITASVTDSLGASDARQITLTITGNAAPTLVLSSPLDGATGTEGVAVALIASASDAEEGDLTASILWSSNLDGPLGGGGALSPSTLSLGPHTITASVTDSLGATDAEQVTLTIEVNQPPIVSIGDPSEGGSFVEGSTVEFSGAAIDSEDGNLTAALIWTSNLDGMLGSGGSVSRSDLSIGVHTVVASVTDGLGLPGSNQITITIAPNQPPVVTVTSPVDGSGVPEQRPVTLAASALDLEDGDLSAAIVWASDVDGALGVGASVVVPELSMGSHVLTAFVVDGHGLPDAAQINVTVEPNVAPTVLIDAPVGLTEIYLGEPIDLMATAMDPEDGDVGGNAVWMSSIDGQVGTGDHVVTDTLSLGLHGITCEATDSHGDTSSAQTVVSVPEPGKLGSLLSGMALLGALLRRSRYRADRRLEALSTSNAATPAN